jgi:hypothetical protein
LSFLIIFPKKSLNEKFNAYVGKYRKTFTPFPLHRDNTPSSPTHLKKQSTIPAYGLDNFVFIDAVYIRSLTLSIGAHDVFAIAPAKPPEKKSIKN